MRHVLAGAGVGLALGAAARWWMRLVSTEPGFTWAGTGFVLAVFTVAGVGIGAASGARARGGSRWWRLAGLLAVPVFLGPGMVLAPALVVGGAALLGAALAWGGSAAFGPWVAGRGDGPPPGRERAAVGAAGTAE